jgi:sarcosine oxidase, subunit alpha
MDSLELDGRRVPIAQDDTIAAAAFRAGVRVYGRSFKFHRPRGLLCLSGDCPSCLVTVDGEPGVCACTTAAEPGQRVSRGGAPSAERDVFGLLWRVRRLLPVGFYYKTLTRPRWAWPRVEPLVRAMTGLGPVPPVAPEQPRPHEALEHVHADLLVIGGGPAGLAAATAGADQGLRVALFERHRLGGLGLLAADRDEVLGLAQELREHPRVRIEERTAAFGVYGGPTIAAAAPAGVLLAHAPRVVVATGALERHLAVAGGDRPGVWLGRGATRLAIEHGLAAGRRVVVVGQTRRVPELLEALRGAGAEVVAHVEREDELVEVRGRRGVSGVVVRRAAGRTRIACDALVASTALVARDGLLRQVVGMPGFFGAGEALDPDCTLEEALASGRRAALGEPQAPPARANGDAPPEPAKTACLCLCEDVLGRDLEQAWAEGFRSSEILKRYTTMTMGPCQGAMCQPHLRAFVARRGGSQEASAPTTAGQPAGALTIAAAAAPDAYLEYRTALHERHVAAGARMEWSGHWRRPWDYGDAEAEYLAVRRAVSMMDLGTLTKFEVAGPDAEDFVDRVYPIRTRTIAAGRYRYALLLDERGYVFDDGLVCRLGESRFYLTLTSGGAHAEMWLQQWADLWGMRVRILNLTSVLGAIVLAGPAARATLEALTEDPVDAEAFPHLSLRAVTIAGIECRALRVGFLGELAYELHHDSVHSVALWDALLAAGAEHGMRPHGLAAQDLLRLEKGHIIVGIDTDFDTSPHKLGMERMMAMDKGHFIGRTALERIGAQPLQRKLVGVVFAAGRPVPEAGTALLRGGAHVGYLTSSGSSTALGRGVALGWVELLDGALPERVMAGELEGEVVLPPFYDPEGERVRS